MAHHGPLCSSLLKKIFLLLIVGFGSQAISEQVAHAQQYLTPQLSNAIEASRMGRATPGQKALLFQNNALINEAALNGWIPDSSYQAVQADYAVTNQAIAKRSAEAAGATFEVQKSTSPNYSPGTDSDFIVEAKSSDPVGQIAEMQDNYNKNVNAYLEDALKAEGMEFKPRKDWHNRLDVDFMADPKHVTDAQFKKIAKLNNDAYTRRNAAEFERTSRANDGTKVSADQFTDYTSEMKDFANKKQKIMSAIRKDPTVLKDPSVMADYHRLMAQEQKYISRIESANDLLRKQEGLSVKKKPKGPPVYEMTINADNTATLKLRPDGSSIASRGSKRSFANRSQTISASAVADNSLNRAISEMSNSMAEAAKKNPTKFPNAGKQIAEMADGLPPNAKGQLIERIKLEHGDAMAKTVAADMRERARAKPKPPGPFLTAAQKLDTRLKTALGVTDDLSQLKGVRRTLNQGAANALGGLDKVAKLGTALELKGAVDNARTYVSSLYGALDPNITDAEADLLFEKANGAALSMAKNGTLGALSELVPTFGAMYAGWSIGFDGTRYVLENTETGQAIDRHAIEYFDRHQKAAAITGDRLIEFLGGESEKMKAEDRLRDLEAAYWRALKEGRIKMKPGVKTLDIAELIRDGDLAGVRDLLEPNENFNPKPKPKPKPAPAKKVAKQRSKTGLDPEFIPQTFATDSDADMEARLRALEKKGESIIGKPQRSGAGTAAKQDSYEARARAIAGAKNASSAAANRSRAQAIINGVAANRNSNIRSQAQQIDQRASAIEAERRRQEQIRQEQIRQAQIRAEQYRQQVARQQQQDAYNRAVAQQQWRQQMLQQQQQQIYSNPRYFGPFPDGSLLGNGQSYGPNIFNTPGYSGGYRPTDPSQQILGRGLNYYPR